MEILLLFRFFCYTAYLLFIQCEETSNPGGTKCANYEGEPQMCYPPFQNHASGGLKIIATNTCGMFKRQKYCVGLSSAEMRSRCAYCDDNKAEERHPADYLTDHNVNNWWQSETLADNKTIHYEQSINLTLNLGKQFHVTFIHLQFKSPRPRAMVIYRKYNDEYPWTPWLYLASNCKTYFNMSDSKGNIIKNFNDVLCTEEFSSLNEFYNGIVMFATIHGRPGSEDFFNNKNIMDWSTASQIRIELKKMHTFGDQNAEEELLLTYFYAIKSIQVAARCWCNGHGNECRRSTGEGIEPKLFCVCHPSHHTTGQSCEQCDKFYQDQPWQMATGSDPNVCKKCNCNDNSDSCIFNEALYIKSGNISGGLCLNCIGNTNGPHCDECQQGFYKDPLYPTRCIPCNCDQTGRASAQCDSHGKCLCLRGVDGDKCTRCKGDHYNFGPFGCQPCNCTAAGINATAQFQCNPSTGVCYCKKNVIGEKCDSCVQGYFSLSPVDPLGCRPCFCFAHTKDCTNASGFVLTEIESKFDTSEDGWLYGVGPEKAVFTPMLDVTTKAPAITWFLNREPWKDNYFLWAPAKFLSNQRLSYNLHLELTLSFGLRPDYKSTKLVSMINDLELISDTMTASVSFNSMGNPQPEAGKGPQVFKYILNEESGEWRDKTDHFRFISILSNLVAIRIRLTNPYGFTRLHKVVLVRAVDQSSLRPPISHLSTTTNVEKCSCPPQFTGLSCENCAVGYHRSSPVGTEFLSCVKCSCNNQSDVCDVRTGACQCNFNTVGPNCERCATGYYGDPTTFIRNVCKPCGCPGGTSCELVKMADSDRVVCTNCPDNLGGYRCNRCRENYFGNPNQNVTCEPCNCHGNIDYMNSCDHLSGKCSNCLYNSAGEYCESCKSGYHLLPNEYAPNRCKMCICHPHGSADGGINCDVTTGQCQCHPFVTGRSCDMCKSGFFKLTPMKACEPCKCFVLGSRNNTCDAISGQCFCKPGIVGINCDRCDSGYFNMTQTGCQKCQCDVFGSQSPNCNLTTGECTCKKSIVGAKCDSCMVNHHNITRGCPNCPPCYTLLQTNVQSIKTEINNIIQNVNLFNGSGNGYQNISLLMTAAEGLNKTVNDIFETVIKNYSRITHTKDVLSQSKSSLDQIVVQLIDLKGSKKNTQLKVVIEEIKFTKNKIETLINVTFKDNLEKLKQYISDKSTSDSNITKMAEIARSSVNEVNQRRDKILELILKTEKDLNGSLVYFVDLITIYYKFINESNAFDIPKIKYMSGNITADSFANLNYIRKLDGRHNSLEISMNLMDKKQSMLNEDIRRLYIELSDIIKNAKYFERKLSKFMSTLPDLDSIEKRILAKSMVNKAETRNMTELLELQQRINNAQKQIYDSVSKAQNVLIKLQEISKNFEDVVNKSKIEATANLSKLPNLRKQLTEIEREIVVLRASSSDIIQKMKTAFSDSQGLQIEVKEIEKKYTDLLSKTLDLKVKSIQEHDTSAKIKETMEVRLKSDATIESEIKNIINTLNDTFKMNQVQLDSTDAITKLLDNLENKLKFLETQSNSMTDERIDKTSKLIDTISSDLSDYENRHLKTLNDEITSLDEEWMALNKEIDDTDAEMKRLETINSYMIGSPTCHRSGGNVES